MRQLRDDCMGSLIRRNSCRAGEAAGGLKASPTLPVGAREDRAKALSLQALDAIQRAGKSAGQIRLTHFSRILRDNSLDKSELSSILTV